MSAKKRKKPVAAPQLSPQKYLRTKGRALPIHECLVNNDWRETGIASIMISRQMPSGNFLLGYFLVDLKCLGLKNTHWKFNLTPVQYESEKQLTTSHLDIESIEYELAHNLIYQGIEYAEQWGFKPSSEFGLTQYLLEEEDAFDADDDLEFGLNGQPFYLAGPYDDSAQILGKLRAHAGEGNFHYLLASDPSHLLPDMDENDNWDEDGANSFGIELVPEHEGLGRILVDQEDKDLLGAREFEVYIANLFWTGFEEAMMTLTKQEGKTFFSDVYSSEEEASEKEVALFRKKIEEHPDQLYFPLGLYRTLARLDRPFNELEETLLLLKERFPDAFMTKLLSVRYLLDAGRVAEAKQLVPDPFDIRAFCPGPDFYPTFGDARLWTQVMAQLLHMTGRPDEEAFFSDLDQYFEQIEDELLRVILPKEE